MRVAVIHVTPHLPDAASGLALRLIWVLLRVAVEALVRLIHRVQIPRQDIGLPERQAEALQGENLCVCVWWREREEKWCERIVD